MPGSLGEFEQAILFVLLELGEDEAYGVRIREAIEERAGRTLSSGAVYTALDRIEFTGDLRGRADSLHYQDVIYNPGVLVEKIKELLPGN